MRTRLDEQLGSAVAEQLTLGTFHSVALRILRQDIERFAPATRSATQTYYRYISCEFSFTLKF